MKIQQKKEKKCNRLLHSFFIAKVNKHQLTKPPETKNEPQFISVTAPFNNMQTLKFKAQPTNAFFATFNQMFCGSSQFPTNAEHAVLTVEL